MDSSEAPLPWREAVRDVAAATMQARGVPGFLVARVRVGAAPEYLALGADGGGRPLDPATLFPVASITKLATALAVLRLAAHGALAIDDPLSRHAPDAAAARDGLRLRSLLCHTAGLPDDLPPGSAPYAPGLDWPALARACLGTPLAHSPGKRVVYSNVGMGLLAVVVERAAGCPFPDALRRLVLAPLGAEAYLGDEPPRTPARLAGDFGEHAGTELEPYNSAFWRSLALPWGGLVTTAAGALALVLAFAGQPAGFLPSSLLAEATRDQTGGLAGGFTGLVEWRRCPWGLGAELRGEKHPHFTPAEAAPTSFGHAGASGCVAWFDPPSGMAWSIHGTRTMHGWWPRLGAVGRAVLGGGP